MDTVTLVTNVGKGAISFCINKYYLDRLITNIRLFRKDINFVDMYIDDYAELDCSQFIPTASGILFIDFESNIILDSQKVSAINKITPTEIRMSMNGKIPDETVSNSLYTRFRELVASGYLHGFERWQDNGNHMNRDIATWTLDELVNFLTKTSDYGQFVFETKPFKVENYILHDYVDQNHLFKRALELNLLPVETHQIWNDYLETLK